MRIALLSWESMHSIPVGGLAAHVTELAAALSRRGHDVHLFTRMGPGQARYDCIEDVHYHRCAFDPHSDFMTYVSRMCDSFLTRLRQLEAYLNRPFDLVHGHDWLAVPAIIQAKDDLEHKVVFTVHSTEYGRCGNELYDGQSELIRSHEWDGTYVADRVICVSRALRDEVQWFYNTPGDKMNVIYNGVNAGKFDADINTASVRRSHGIAEDDQCVLFAGRLAWQKGPDLLVEAMPNILRRHPATKFVFAGEGDMRAGLEARVSDLGLAPATRFVGHRNGLELISLFKSADAICVPSRNEPFGIVILEAWSASKPVIATRNGGPAEFVTHEGTGLTVRDQVDSIGWGVETMLAEKENAVQMGLNGRQEAETRFSWDSIAAETEKVYTQVHSSAGTPSSGGSREVAKMARRSTTTTKKTTAKSTRKATTTNTRSGGPSTAKKRATTKKTTEKATYAAAKMPTTEQIQQRAYEIFLARNGTPGDAQADWLQAERELNGLSC